MIRHLSKALAVLLSLLAAPLGAAAQPEVVRIATMGIYAGGELKFTGIDAVIEQQGWLKAELAKRGIKFEWFPVSNAAVGPLINEGFASKQLHFAGYGDLPSIIVNAKGEKTVTKVLVPSSSSGDAFLAVPANSTATKIEDLKGKRLAVHKGRPWELPLLRLLESKGLSYSDFQIFNINPDAGATAVATGAIDGLFTIQAYALEEKGVARIIWSTKEAPLSWKMGMGFWGAREFIEAYPEIAQLVVTAYIKAAHWSSLDENREAFLKPATLNGTSENLVRRTYEDPGLSWRQRFSPLWSEVLSQQYRDTIAFAVDKKIVRKSVKVEDIVDNSFAQKAVHELGLDDYWQARQAAVR